MCFDYNLMSIIKSCSFVTANFLSSMNLQKVKLQNVEIFLQEGSANRSKSSESFQKKNLALSRICLTFEPFGIVSILRDEHCWRPRCRIYLTFGLYWIVSILRYEHSNADKYEYLQRKNCDRVRLVTCRRLIFTLQV